MYRWCSSTSTRCAIPWGPRPSASNGTLWTSGRRSARAASPRRASPGRPRGRSTATTELFSLKLPDGGSALPPFVNLSQARVEEVLDELIARQPLIDVRRGHRVTGLTQPGRVVVECETADGPRRIEADYAIACAGARGDAVRRALGQHLAGVSFRDLFLICDIRADLPGWAAERRFYFDPPWNPGPPGADPPVPGLGVPRSTGRSPRTTTSRPRRRAGPWTTRIRAIIGPVPYEVVWRSVYRFHTRLVPRMRVGRVLLAGDCAHLVAPFGARGLNSGVADAENAAWKLAGSCAGDAGEELLESYHTERHAAAVENAAVTTATMDFLVPQDDEQRGAPPGRPHARRARPGRVRAGRLGPAGRAVLVRGFAVDDAGSATPVRRTAAARGVAAAGAGRAAAGRHRREWTVARPGPAGVPAADDAGCAPPRVCGRRRSRWAARWVRVRAKPGWSARTRTSPRAGRPAPDDVTAAVRRVRETGLAPCFSSRPVHG